MADPVLTSGQYSIGKPGSASAFVFGGRQGSFANGIQIQNTQIDTGSLAVQDTAVVGHDGVLFGVDTQPGMVITQTGQAQAATPLAAMDAYDALAGVWNDPAVRLANDTVVVLRAFYPGSTVVRRCYGRGRKIMPTLGLAYAGLVPFTSQFQASDTIWYADIESTLTMTMIPSFTGGLTWPVTPPFQWAAQTNFQASTMVNAGSLPTWPVLTFTGPISFPGLTYVNTPVSIGYNGSLKNGDTLVIDTRPWARTVLLNGTSVAGALTGDPMIGLQLQPGSTLVHFTGQDFTGSSQMVARWRSAHQMIGGST